MWMWMWKCHKFCQKRKEVVLAQKENRIQRTQTQLLVFKKLNTVWRSRKNMSCQLEFQRSESHKTIAYRKEQLNFKKREMKLKENQIKSKNKVEANKQR